LPDGELYSEILIEKLNVNVLFGLSSESFDKFVVHGAGVSFVQGSDGYVVAGG
jgi:hypothetical protein